MALAAYGSGDRSDGPILDAIDEECRLTFHDEFRVVVAGTDSGGWLWLAPAAECNNIGQTDFPATSNSTDGVSGEKRLPESFSGSSDISSFPSSMTASAPSYPGLNSITSIFTLSCHPRVCTRLSPSPSDATSHIR
jgi:hypothetical protein